MAESFSEDQLEEFAKVFREYDNGSGMPAVKISCVRRVFGVAGTVRANAAACFRIECRVLPEVQRTERRATFVRPTALENLLVAAGCGAQAIRDLGHSLKQAEVRRIISTVPDGLAGRVSQAQFVDILVRELRRIAFAAAAPATDGSVIQQLGGPVASVQSRHASRRRHASCCRCVRQLLHTRLRECCCCRCCRVVPCGQAAKVSSPYDAETIKQSFLAFENGAATMKKERFTNIMMKLGAKLNEEEMEVRSCPVHRVARAWRACLRDCVRVLRDVATVVFVVALPFIHSHLRIWNALPPPHCAALPGAAEGGGRREW
jgi:hypothetical protein